MNIRLSVKERSRMLEDASLLGKMSKEITEKKKKQKYIFFLIK